MRAGFLKAFALIAAFILATGLATAQEMRIQSITVYDDINDTAAIQTWVNEAVALKYNAITVHTRYRGDSTYFPNKNNSTYPNPEPRTSAAGSIDVLQEFVTRGHAAGLKVFAYVNIFLVTDGQNTDPRPSHVLNTHPEWVTYAYNGGSPRKMTVADDPEGIWVDPYIAAVRNYNTNIVADICANYQVDGICIDRIRYPQTTFTRANRDFGYHPSAVAAFNSQYGKSGIPSPADTQWWAFRRAQVNQQVQDIYARMNTINPQLILLAFPIGRLNDAINFNYCDWPAWLNNNYIDAVMPQVYRDSTTDFQNGVIEHKAAYTGSRFLGFATKAYGAGIAVETQLKYVENDATLEGTSPFRHGTLSVNGYYDDVQRAYATARSFPSMPWKAPVEYIVDNGTTGFTASTNWWATTSTPGYYGSNYLVRTTAAVSDAANWKVNLPTSGNYEVFVRYTSGSNRPTAAPYIVYHTGGSTTKNINQTTGGGAWVSLGTYSMASGNSTRVALSCWTTAGKSIIADAVRLVKK